MAVLPEAQAGLMNTITLYPGSAPKPLYGGRSASVQRLREHRAVTVTVRPGGMVSLQPGRCFNEWGPMLTFTNDGKGIVIVHYRSIARITAAYRATSSQLEPGDTARCERSGRGAHTTVRRTGTLLRVALE